MKNIYCIEFNFLSHIDNYSWTLIEEYDNEEKFKQELINSINQCSTINKIFIKEVNDDYKATIKL
jgi:hypothetical protein